MNAYICTAHGMYVIEDIEGGLEAVTVDGTTEYRIKRMLRSGVIAHVATIRLGADTFIVLGYEPPRRVAPLQEAGHSS